MKRLLSSLAAAVLAFCLVIPAAQGVSLQTESPALRVGYPTNAGMSDWENGQPVGYTFDYLQEVAQYTGWDYEFVQLEDTDNDEMVELLERGELDLIGGLSYDETRAQRVAYSGLSYGSVNLVLAVLEDNIALTEGNLQMANRLRVGVPRGGKGDVPNLEEYCQNNRLEMDVVYLDGALESMRDQLEQGEIDALLCTDLCTLKGLRIVAKFSPKPLYLATARKNTAIASQLDTAILMINESDPNFSARLNEKYFGGDGGQLVLTQADKAFLAQERTLRVLYNPNRAPLQYKDENDNFAGVFRAVFDYISQQTGLNFTYIPVADQEAAARMLRSGEADLIAEAIANKDNADFYHIALTRSYLSSQLAIVMNDTMDPEQLEGKSLALPTDFVYNGYYVGTLVQYDTEQECIQAVDRGEADYTYSNVYSASYFIRQGGYKNVQSVPQSGLDRNYCIGVAKPVDTELLSILNKAIRSISTDTLQSMIYQNAFQSQEYTLKAYLRSNPKVAIVAVSVPAILIIIGLSAVMTSRGRFNRRLATENERYRQLCALSGECLYEYDYAKDQLTLSGQNAQLFGGEQCFEQFRNGVGGEGYPDSRRELSALLEQEGVRELLLRMPDGPSRWFRAIGKITRDGDGSPVYHVGKLVDIQSEKEELQALEERAQRDSLTGAYNAAACRHIIGERLEKGSGGALIIIDLDHFKQVNDEHGHYTGDQVLIDVSRVLQNLFRRGDVVGRQGGDEFLVYLPYLESKAIVEEKCSAILRDCANAPGRIGGLPITLSIGVAMVGDCQDYESVYRLADEALYKVKNHGRNGFAFA